MSRKLPDSMPWQIYQAYLLGPHALFRLFEEAFGRQALYGTPEPDQQQREINNLSEHIARLKEQIEKLQAEVRQLHYRTFQLGCRNAELEGLSTKDSHNSSRPPSTDPPWAKRTRSLRRPTGRRPGGQAGHRGATLRLAARPNRVIEHRPQECRGCHAPLATAQVVRHNRQQVWEVVPARLKVTEHRLAVLRCPSCGKTTQGEFSGTARSGVQYGPGVKARVLYLQQYQLLPYQRTSEAMRDLFGCRLSAGTVANIVRECAEALVAIELKIKQKLRRSPVIHSDETGLRINKRLGYVHVASTAHLTHYAAAAHRGHTAMDEINVLPRYRGTCVHDGLLAYKYYTRCRHALCGVHLLRELTYFEELGTATKAWATPLKELLLEMKREVERASAQGGRHLAADRLAELTGSYDSLVAAGLRAQQPSELPEQVRKQARNLLLRLERRKEEVLRFLTDFSVPFDNNQAERDLRMVKLQQKTSGCFRSEEGARRFCRIRSYVSTTRKQGQTIMRALEGACRGKPLSLRKRSG
ncbi:MAG TPA: IS66 family transposase [Pyrinomonadaceae bacterium]|jgi:transposase|nr:IS66 family transposase [Pyrinomonadaceae bacterium]